MMDLGGHLARLSGAEDPEKRLDSSGTSADSEGVTQMIQAQLDQIVSAGAVPAMSASQQQRPAASPAGRSASPKNTATPADKAADGLREVTPRGFEPRWDSEIAAFSPRSDTFLSPSDSRPDPEPHSSDAPCTGPVHGPAIGRAAGGGADTSLLAEASDLLARQAGLMSRMARELANRSRPDHGRGHTAGSAEAIVSPTPFGEHVKESQAWLRSRQAHT